MARGVWSWVLLVVGVAVCCVFAYGASAVASYSWNQVVSYKSPYSAEPLATVGPSPAAPLARHVVLVIVDGMRDDVTRSQMPAVDRLRQYGADVEVRTYQPSLSYPNWTTILTGAPQGVSGVTTNWWKGRVPTPTLVDVALSEGRTVAVVGPTDFADLYGIRRSPLVSLRDWPEGGYLTSTLVDDALRISKTSKPDLLVVHLPDLDEAGHDYGGMSTRYREVATKIDADIGRLVSALQGDDTAFVVTSDHGHIDSGGHGGWEPEVTRVPLIVSGAGARLGSQATAMQDQTAATVAVLAGLRPPPFSAGTSIRSALATDALSVYAAENAQRLLFLDRELSVIVGDDLAPPQRESVASAEQAVAEARNLRLEQERRRRLERSLGILGATLLTLLFVAVVSWRAFVAALAGTAAYYAAYNFLYFTVHGYLWSLSAFNTEEYVKTFFNIRMVEAAGAGLLGVAVAAIVYPMLRASAKGPRDRGYLGGWLALAPATVLVIQMTLAVQVAWFLWAYGADITWTLPDFKWAFKYDLDLIQATGLAGAALVGPLVSYVIGRYHPRVWRAESGRRRPSSGGHGRRRASADHSLPASSEG